ncbi:hypothetical protein [Undibacterium sp. RuRC25W]|uniref:hypothetical protein n=1 Tax=Undibacterium sp. RuRC25W TaxID=3413047 RepID=UPI003BF3D0FD
MFKTTRHIASATILAGLAVLSIQSAFAQDATFAKEHPRRAEVVAREKHEKATTAKEVKNGALTKAQGKQLNKEDTAIRKEERADAAADNGHITKAQQRQLNRQENAVNAQRKADIQSNKVGVSTGK